MQVVPESRSFVHAAAWVVVVSVILACGHAGVGTAGEEQEPLVRRLERIPVTIQYTERDEKVANKVSSVCERAIPLLASQIGLRPVGEFQIVLTHEMAEYRAKYGLPSWGIAFAFMESQVMLVDVDKAVTAWNSLDEVIPHELSHLLLAQRMGGTAMPRWFVEGLALWQAREWSLLESWRLMEAVWGNRAPGLWQIHDRLPAEQKEAREAYRVAYAAFTSLFERQFELLPVFLDAVVRAGGFAEGFERYWGENEFAFYERFHHALHRKYRSRLLLFQTGPLFTMVAVLFVFVYLRIKLRNRRKLRRLEAAERGLSLDDF